MLIIILIYFQMCVAVFYIYICHFKLFLTDIGEQKHEREPVVSSTSLNRRLQWRGVGTRRRQRALCVTVTSQTWRRPLARTVALLPFLEKWEVAYLAQFWSLRRRRVATKWTRRGRQRFDGDFYPVLGSCFAASPLLFSRVKTKTCLVLM